jgi:hypothetical protein
MMNTRPRASLSRNPSQRHSVLFSAGCPAELQHFSFNFDLSNHLPLPGADDGQPKLSTDDGQPYTTDDGQQKLSHNSNGSEL